MAIPPASITSTEVIYFKSCQLQVSLTWPKATFLEEKGNSMKKAFTLQAITVHSSNLLPGIWPQFLCVFTLAQRKGCNSPSWAIRVQQISFPQSPNLAFTRRAAAIVALRQCHCWTPLNSLVKGDIICLCEDSPQARFVVTQLYYFAYVTAQYKPQVSQ